MSTRRPSAAMFVVKKIAKKQGKKQAKKAINNLERAYALVDADGSVSSDVPSRNLTSADISNSLDGFYCVDLPFAPTTAAGTGSGGGVEDGFVTVKLAGDEYDGCPASAEAEVSFFDVSDNDFSNGPFLIQFDGW